MKLKRIGKAGTLESCDILIHALPYDGEIIIELESELKDQFGSQIEVVILETIDRLQIDSVLIKAQDRGALDYAIRARTETALLRGLNDDTEF